MNKQNKSNRNKRKSNRIDADKSYTDFLCPICLELLIEPVQMPCKHELCMDCFTKHVHNTSLTCPMCRIRVGVWARKNKLNNTLINEERWMLIKSLFPERVRRRLNGLDDLEESFDEYVAVPKHVIAADGEVKKEYEEELKRLKVEDEKINQENLEYIQKLREEDEEQKRKQMELDEAAAHALQKEEMTRSGGAFKDPTEQQRAVLAYFKPKAPMALRNRTIPSKKLPTKTPLKSPPPSTSKLKSPNHTITSFFRTTLKSDNKIRTIETQTADNETVDTTWSTNKTILISSNKDSGKPSCSKTLMETDFELAKRLQGEFDQEVKDIKKVECNIIKSKSNNPKSNKIGKYDIKSSDKKRTNVTQKSILKSELQTKGKRNALKSRNSISTLNDQNNIRKYLNIHKISDQDENSPQYLI